MAPRLLQKESRSLLPSHHNPEKARLQAHYTEPSPSARQEEDVRLRERMPSPKHLLTTIVVAFLVTVGLAAVVIPRDGMPCHDVRGHHDQMPPEVQGPMPEPDSRSFADLLEQVSPHSLHRLLSTYFPRRYRHGVFESEHHALEAVHAGDPELASSIVKIAKRQDNNSTDTPTDTATDEPDSNTPTPTENPDTDTPTPTPTPTDNPDTDTPEPTPTPTPDPETSNTPTPGTTQDTTTPPANTNQSPSASTPAGTSPPDTDSPPPSSNSPDTSPTAEDESPPTSRTSSPDETTSPVVEESTSSTRAETPDATEDDTTTTTRTTQTPPTTSTTTTKRTTSPTAATEEPKDDETTTNKPTKTTSVSMKKTSTPVTATITSTKPNGEVTLVTSTSYVEFDVPATETGEAGSLQTDDAASVPNIPAFPALAGAILGGLALI